MIWDQVLRTAKWVGLPIVFLASAAVMWYGAIYLAVGRPLVKLGGLGLLGLALAGFSIGLWVMFGRPAHWFPPGENTEFDPRR